MCHSFSSNFLAFLRSCTVTLRSCGVGACAVFVRVRCTHLFRHGVAVQEVQFGQLGDDEEAVLEDALLHGVAVEIEIAQLRQALQVPQDPAKSIVSLAMDGVDCTTETHLC